MGHGDEAGDEEAYRELFLPSTIKGQKYPSNSILKCYRMVNFGTQL